MMWLFFFLLLTFPPISVGLGLYSRAAQLEKNATSASKDGIWCRQVPCDCLFSLTFLRERTLWLPWRLFLLSLLHLDIVSILTPLNQLLQSDWRSCTWWLSAYEDAFEELCRLLILLLMLLRLKPYCSDWSIHRCRNLWTSCYVHIAQFWILWIYSCILELKPHHCRAELLCHGERMFVHNLGAW